MPPCIYAYQCQKYEFVASLPDYKDKCLQKSAIFIDHNQCLMSLGLFSWYLQLILRCFFFPFRLAVRRSDFRMFGRNRRKTQRKVVKTNTKSKRKISEISSNFLPAKLKVFPGMVCMYVCPYECQNHLGTQKLLLIIFLFCPL